MGELSMHNRWLLGGLLSLSIFSGMTAAEESEQETSSFFIDTQTIAPERLNREVTNPLTSYFLLHFQNDFSLLDGDLAGIDDEWSNVFQFAPTIPIRLNFADLHLVNQFVFPVFSLREPTFAEDPRSPTGIGVSYDEASAFGDIFMTNYLAQTADNGRIIGFGPAFSFPTATDDITGVATEKFQMGPAAIVGYLPEFGSVWTYASVQQLWSIGGSSYRPDVNRTTIQYFYQFNLHGTARKGFWSIGASPIIMADWEMGSGDVWSVPIGTGVVYTGEIAPNLWVRFGAEIDYYVVRPDTAGREWNFRLFFSPMLPINPGAAIAAAF